MNCAALHTTDLERSPIGLCEHCRHADIVTSNRGATFYLCLLSLVDSRYPKYPTLPVLACEGYAARAAEG